jgi:hypothetical protein
MSYIDTVGISYNLPLSPEWVETWDDKSEKKGRKTYRMKLNFIGKKSILVTYHPNDLKGDPNPTLVYYFSLPNMVKNCNHNLIYDLSEAIAEANSLLNGHNKLPSVRLEEGTLYRIDLVYQYSVGNLVQDYVASIFNCHYSHRDTNPYKYRGVSFPSKHETTKFYDKEKQCHHPEAYGNLRHEKTIRGNSYIAKLLRKNAPSELRIIKRPTIQDIDQGFKKPGLEKDLDRLGLNGTLICNRELAAEKLVQHYGRIIGEKLIGYWSMRQGCTREQLVSLYDYDMRTVNRKEKMIQDAGVAMISNEKVALPPLVIEM